MLTENLKFNLLDTFNVSDISQLIHLDQDTSRIVITSDDEHNIITITIQKDEGLNIEGPEGDDVEKLHDILDIEFERISHETLIMRVSINEELIVSKRVKNFEEIITESIATIPEIFGYIFDGYIPYFPAYILPDSRAGIIRTREVLSYVLIRDRYIPAGLFINKADSEFLANLESLPIRRERIGEGITRIAEFIERSIEAKFIIDKTLPEKYVIEYRGLKIPTLRAPSGFREIAPIVYFIKYALRPGYILIIEEPETHLHPHLQSIIMRAFTGLSKYCFIIITTHSIHIIDELNNLIKLNKLPSEIKRKLGYEDWEGTSHNDVAIYVFKRDGIVEEVEISENGISETELDRVVIELGNKHAIIEREFRKLVESVMTHICRDDCLERSVHEQCCSSKCTCCTILCRFNNCESSTGCDVIAVIHNDIYVTVELKSGRLGRDDAKDAIKQLHECVEHVERLGFQVMYAVVYYGKRVDDTARNYIYREKHLLKVKGISVLLCRCGEDLCKVLHY